MDSKSLLGVTAALLLLSVVVAAVPPDHAPAASPIVCTPVETTRPIGAAVFYRSREVVGAIAKQPASVHAFEMEDERPYGDAAQRTVELARFDGVPVRAPDGFHSASVTLSLAFDADTGEFVCAFTESKPEWVESLTHPATIEARVAKAGWRVGPAQGELESTLTDVLEAAWKRFGVDPSEAGQVVIRPRFVANEYPADDVGGKLVPRHPPANVWIVEVLGVSLVETDVDGEERVVTTLVAQFRDGDLESLPNLVLP